MPEVVSQTIKEQQAARLGVARMWRRVGLLAACFAVIVGLGMCWGYLAGRREDPLNSPRLKELKNSLRQNPTDKKLKEDIRILDLRLRERYFEHISQLRSGVWLLLAGAGLALVSLGKSETLRTLPRVPFGQAVSKESQRRTIVLGIRAVFGIAIASAAGLLLFSSSGPRAKLSSAAGNVAHPAPLPAGPDYASASELEHAWARFRGNGGNGFDASGKAPLGWDAASGKGIAWKVASPLQGFNSPLVFGDHIYFSGGDAQKVEVVSLKLADGQVAWRQAVALAHDPSAEVPESTGYAPCSAATDGRRVYAMFADGRLGAFTLDGKPVWTKAFGKLSNPYGHATSLMTWQDRLIVQLDQGDSSEGKSILYALDGRTGKPVWQKPRPVGASWATPILIEANGKSQIITLSVPWVISYSAEDGSELWRADCLNGEVTPSPIFAGGMVVVASPSDKIVAFKPDGTGDVSKTHLVWSFDENIPDVTTPVSNGELVFFVTTSGTLTCLDLKDGKKVWDHDLGMECHASPLISGDRLYQVGQDGTFIVLSAKREYKELFKAKLEDNFHATPALVDGNIVLRGISNVWRITGESGTAAKEPNVK